MDAYIDSELGVADGTDFTGAVTDSAALAAGLETRCSDAAEFRSLLLLSKAESFVTTRAAPLAAVTFTGYLLDFLLPRHVISLLQVHFPSLDVPSCSSGKH